MTARAGRLLIIKTLRRDGARWLADAEYGSGPDHLERVELTATAAGVEVAVTFVTGHGYRVRLTLVQADVLEGTQTVGDG